MFGSILGTLGSGLSSGLGYAGNFAKYAASNFGPSILASGLDAGVSSAFGLLGANSGYKRNETFNGAYNCRSNISEELN